MNKIIKKDKNKIVMELSEDSFVELSQEESEKLNKSNEWLK